jgi:hypothetical protein
MYVPHIVLDIVRMTGVIDSAIKTDLQHLRYRYFVCLLVSTAIVGIGLLLEVFEIAHDMWGVRKKKSIELKYWLAPSMERREYRTPDWMKVLTAVGWLLIVVGVMGEGVFEGYVSWADGTLQTFNDILLGEAQKEAAFGIEGASQAQKENSELSIVLIKLRRSSGWRYLSPQEQDELAKALRKYPKHRVVMEFESGHEEREKFADNFGVVFGNKLRWDASKWSAKVFFPSGITIRVVDPSHPPQAALALKSALENLDFPFFSKIEAAQDARGIKDAPRYFEVMIGENPQNSP